MYIMNTGWISRASLDGGDIQILLEAPVNLCYYFDISIDYENQLLYWTYSSGIEVMSTIGLDRRFMYTTSFNSQSILVLNDKTIYFWQSKNLYSLDISISNSERKLLYSILSCHSIQDSKIIAQQQQCKL